MIKLFRRSNLEKMLDKAVELMETRQYFKAEESLRNIIKSCRQVKNLHIEATALEHLGNSLFMQRRFGEAFLVYSKGLAIYKREFPYDHLGKARCLHGLGDVLQFIGDDVDANTYYRQAETSYEAAGDSEKARYCRERYSAQTTRLEGWVSMVCEALKKETSHPDADVIKQVAYLLGSVSSQIMNPSEIELPVEILEELLKKESDPQVRKVAHESLQKLSERKIFRL